MKRCQLIANERLKWLADLLKNIASAAVIGGLVTPLLTAEIRWLPSISVGMMIAVCCGWVSHKMLGDLRGDD
ncbi:hypothetical protein [Bradyrhizobium sp. SZCCHNS3052]|uniref:hypothetical protein n=1 Tax=Bradyrhizobium sp. SZCCHNS3052 TaxID=3057321 RepID=UPI0029160ACC|nr:hypothetical protein [Bradyrhizobium sp. SZCCHNS3052]